MRSHPARFEQASDSEISTPPIERRHYQLPHVEEITAEIAHTNERDRVTSSLLLHADASDDG